MRVAHIKHDYLRPSETFIHTLLTHFGTAKPTVLTDVGENVDRFPISIRQLASAKDFEIVRSSGGLRVAQRFRHSLGFPGSYSELVRAEGFSVLHAHFGDAGVASLGLRRDTGLPLVTTFYGYDTSVPLRDRRYRERMARALQASDRVIALGESMVSRLQRIGCSEAAVRIVRVGVDVDRITFSERTAPDKGPVRILFCGRLVAKKGVLDAIQAFRLIGAKYHAQLRIVGDGPERRSAERLVDESGLGDTVKFLGTLPYPSLLEEFTATHLFILPSKTARNGDMEGTPTVLLEAQAAGIPVVSTRHSGIPEVVPEEHRDYLAEEGDCEALASRLGQLLNDPGSWGVIGRVGRAHVERQFDVKGRVTELERIYAEVA